MVDRIRIMLGFQAEGTVSGIVHAALAGDGAVEMVCGVELHPGFGGEDLEDTARPRFNDAGAKGR